MAPPIDLKFNRALATRVRHLAGLGAQAQEYATRAVTNIGRAAAKRAAQHTPRSAGSGPHVADGWTTEEKAHGQDVEIRVYNRLPRATELLKLANGTTTPYSLLDILEYGSREHEIVPVRAEFLVFFWPAAGRVIRTKRVRHPGTQPYSMLALAQVQANVDLKRAADALRAVVKLALLGKTSRLAASNPFGG
jgi:hypothetical protein